MAWRQNDSCNEGRKFSEDLQTLIVNYKTHEAVHRHHNNGQRQSSTCGRLFSHNIFLFLSERRNEYYNRHSTPLSFSMNTACQRHSLSKWTSTLNATLFLNEHCLSTPLSFSTNIDTQRHSLSQRTLPANTTLFLNEHYQPTPLSFSTNTASQHHSLSQRTLPVNATLFLWTSTLNATLFLNEHCQPTPLSLSTNTTSQHHSLSQRDRKSVV